MAKIAFSPLITDARKKAGSAVFSKSRTGNYVKRRVVPRQPRTTSQLAVRADFKANSQAFRGIGQTNITGWNTLGAATTHTDRLGNKFAPSGIQLYQLANRNLSSMGQAALNTPPANFNVDSPTGLVITAVGGGTPSMTVNPSPAPAATDYILIYAVTPQSAGKSSNSQKAYRLIAVVIGTTTLPHSVLTAWQAKFGTLTTGTAINLGVRYGNPTNGATSGMVTTRLIAG